MNIKGVATKVYIISEDESSGIVLANVINAANQTAIMSEVASDDYSELIDEAVDRLGEGYDLTALISKAPAEACIAANKTSRLRAVVCKTQSDAANARKAKANMIIIDAANVSKTAASSIMRGLFSTSSAPAKEEPEPEDEEGESAIAIAGKSARSLINSGAGIIKGLSKPSAKVKRASKDEEEDEEDLKKPKGGGMVENIKYIFGIE